MNAPRKPPIPAPAGKATEQQFIAGIERLIADGVVDLALSTLVNQLAKQPQNPNLWLLKAKAHNRRGEAGESAAALRKGADLLPKRQDLRLHLAKVAHGLAQDADELAALREALAIAPLAPPVMMRLIDLELERKEFEPAIAHAQELVAAHPGNDGYLIKQVQALAEGGRVHEAADLLAPRMAVEAPPDAIVTAWVNVTADRLQRGEEALERLRALSERPDCSWQVRHVYGKVLAKLDQVKAAEAVFKRALEDAPDQAGIWFDLAVLQRQDGQIEDSQQALMRSLELDPMNASAMRVAGYEHKYAYGDDAFKRVNLALAEVHKRSKKEQLEIHYAAAKALEDVGELEAAFAQYARAGAIQKELLPWEESRMRGVLNLMKHALKPEDYAAVRREGFATDKPVFVFGMPRSGTTLLEQVIASHPQAFGAGELKLGAGVINRIQMGRARIETTHEGGGSLLVNCDGMSIHERGQKYVEIIESLGGPQPLRIVDKMPSNYNWVGLLDAILPGAHFIHSRRHPVEICLSEYRIYFPDGIPFSYDLADLGKAYRLYHDYMAYWQELMGERILHVRYEDMVADLETQARRILAHIGLPWDDACLRFYETERKVKTASVAQVRKPIYTTSTNRWRKYEKYLGPLLKEIGDLVEQYEAEIVHLSAK